MLHESLTELAHQAPRCEIVPEFLGILRESQDLARNALNHTGTSSREVTAWYAGVLLGLLGSPAAREMAPDVRIVPTGCYASEMGLPLRTVEWCAITPTEGRFYDERLAGVISKVGQRVLSYGCLTPQQWNARLDAAQRSSDVPRNARFLLALIDAADDSLPCPDPALARAVVFRHMLAVRPRSLTWQRGLPDRNAVADVETDLLIPIEAIARFLQFNAGSDGLHPRTTVEDRVLGAASAGLLSQTDAADLLRAWTAAIDLFAIRWRDGLHNPETTISDLPGIQRPSYGAAARTIAATIDMLGRSTTL